MVIRAMVKRGCVLVGWGLLFSGVAIAANPKPAHRISFRTVKPVAGHFSTAKEASVIESTLQQLGCATKKSQHDGHVDVTYECRYWRTLRLKDASEVDQWNRWLTAKGFAVVHNTPPQDHPEAVSYTLPVWKTLHFNEPRDAKAHVEMFRMLGCEVKQVRHNGHDDVRFRCNTWKDIGVATHQQAHDWMKVLRKYGFSVRHEH